MRIIGRIGAVAFILAGCGTPGPEAVPAREASAPPAGTVPKAPIPPKNLPNYEAARDAARTYAAARTAENWARLILLKKNLNNDELNRLYAEFGRLSPPDDAPSVRKTPPPAPAPPAPDRRTISCMVCAGTGKRPDGKPCISCDGKGVKELDFSQPDGPGLPEP